MLLDSVPNPLNFGSFRFGIVSTPRPQPPAARLEVTSEPLRVEVQGQASGTWVQIPDTIILQ